MLKDLLTAFYAKLRVDPVLGPVFIEIIGDDWDAHMETIHRFWATVTRVGTGYKGRDFLPTHTKHPSIKVDQLPHWLALFRETAHERCRPDAAAVLIDIAERVAENIAIGLDARDRRTDA